MRAAGAGLALLWLGKPGSGQRAAGTALCKLPGCSRPRLRLLPQELGRTRRERSSEFARLAHGFAQVDASYGERCLDIWRGVADDFGAGSQLEAQQRSWQ